MQKPIKTKNEAESFFLANSSGSCLVINKIGKEKECHTYPEATEWLDKEASIPELEACLDPEYNSAVYDALTQLWHGSLTVDQAYQVILNETVARAE